MTVRCSRCGQEWQRDPALEVPCPSCPAEIGQKCRRPSGHPASIHVDRDRRALEAGMLEPCPAAETSQSDGAEQSSHQTTLSDVQYRGNQVWKHCSQLVFLAPRGGEGCSDSPCLGALNR
jgi:predicted  nucleic acid-binding Zn-ribbon protein